MNIKVFYLFANDAIFGLVHLIKNKVHFCKTFFQSLEIQFKIPFESVKEIISPNEPSSNILESLPFVGSIE